MADDRKFLDPLALQHDDLPVIVLVDDLRGFVAWMIKSHTSGNYGHAMVLYSEGKVVSQDFSGFHSKSINDYMKPSNMLKFWRIKNLTLAEKDFIAKAINRRLSLPWWGKMYDFLGLLGQALNLTWIQNPWKRFCSEEVRDDYINQVERTWNSVSKKPSPSELDAAFKLRPYLFECVGYWWID